MVNNNKQAIRIFKTPWFYKVARKAKISDGELIKAINQVLIGKVDDLGGGVYKKRIQDNRYRAIIITKAGGFWIYSYLFAKKDRNNIENDELEAFRKLAKIYAKQSADFFDKEIRNGNLVEIKYEQEKI